MIYLFENPDNNASIIYQGSTLTNEQKQRAVAIEQLPVAEKQNGKIAILKVSKSENRVWYAYQDDLTKSDITLLKERVDATEQALLQLLLEGGGL